MPVTVERCNTPGDLVHGLVREGLAQLLSVMEGEDRWLPALRDAGDGGLPALW